MRAELAVSEAERVELARRARQLVRKPDRVLPMVRVRHPSRSRSCISSVCCRHVLAPTPRHTFLVPNSRAALILVRPRLRSGYAAAGDDQSAAAPAAGRHNQLVPGGDGHRADVPRARCAAFRSSCGEPCYQASKIYFTMWYCIDLRTDAAAPEVVSSHRVAAQVPSNPDSIETCIKTGWQSSAARHTNRA